MTKKKVEAIETFVPTLYVSKDHDRSDENDWWYMAQETYDGFADGEDVAIYKLVEVKKMHITEELI